MTNFIEYFCIIRDFKLLHYRIENHDSNGIEL